MLVIPLGMKTLGTLLAVLIFPVAIVLATDPARSGRGSSGQALTGFVAVPDGPRHVEGEVKVVVAKVGTLLEAGWYDLAPGAAAPAGGIKEAWKSMPNPIFVRGLGANLYDGAEWAGMLVPDGNYTFRTLTGMKTVLAFRLSDAPDPIVALRAAKASTWQPKGTSLDQRAKR